MPVNEAEPRPAAPTGRRALSRGSAWAVLIAIVIALPPLHLLSVPFVTYYSRPSGSHPMLDLGHHNPIPPWAMTYRKPYDWLIKNTTLRMPLANYDLWCAETLWRRQMAREHRAAERRRATRAP
jgi:hypothetical protein